MDAECCLKNALLGVQLGSREKCAVGLDCIYHFWFLVSCTYSDIKINKKEKICRLFK